MFLSYLVMSTKAEARAVEAAKKEAATVRQFAELAKVAKTTSDKPGKVEDANSQESNGPEISLRSVSESAVFALVQNNAESVIASIVENAFNSHLFLSNIDKETATKNAIKRYNDIVSKIITINDIANVIKFVDAKFKRESDKETKRETKKTIKANVKTLISKSKEEYIKERYNYYIENGVNETIAKTLSVNDYNNLIKK